MPSRSRSRLAIRFRKADMPADTHFIRPARGRWRRMLLNLLLRVAVKWRLGLQVDVPMLRRLLGVVNRQAIDTQLGVRREPVQCDGVDAEWLTPDGYQPDRVLLYIHGGAFVARSPDAHAAMVAPWCRALNARALMVDYHLAPEHQYPAALNDCHAAYRWMLEQGIEAGHIVLAGDSAGGNLALAMLHRVQAGGGPLPVCAVLLSPFLDFTLSGDSALGNARRDPIFTPAFAIGIRGLYAASDDYLNPEVSPLFGDYRGLPPLLFQVGSSEMLLDDAVRAATRAHAAGLQTRLEVWEHMPHVFQSIAALPQTTAATRSILVFVSSHTGWDVSWGPGSSA